MQLKLNEIVAAMHEHYATLTRLAQKDENLLRSHSVDEAGTRHDLKRRRRHPRKDQEP